MQMLGLLSDLLLIGATIGLAAWCRLLSVRLKASDDVDRGAGGTVAALAGRIDALHASVASASAAADGRGERLAAAGALADDRIGRMEMLLASLEELEEESADRLLQAAAPAEAADGFPRFRASRATGPGGHS